MGADGRTGPTANPVADTVADTAYTAVGFVLLAFQRLQVARRDLAKLARCLSALGAAARPSGAAADGQP